MAVFGHGAFCLWICMSFCLLGARASPRRSHGLGLRPGGTPAQGGAGGGEGTKTTRPPCTRTARTPTVSRSFLSFVYSPLIRRSGATNDVFVFADFNFLSPRGHLCALFLGCFACVPVFLVLLFFVLHVLHVYSCLFSLLLPSSIVFCVHLMCSKLFLVIFT